ncbi:MAG: radical SAM protein [Candidatus Aminicenantes bacterium]|nr:radical SAM protein [Candidatus Aminicenantes bacterium]
MRYSGQVIRPPSEARSYLLQITYGCSWNRCTFCPAYLDKPFKIRPMDEIEEDLLLAREAYPDARRVFLCDGDGLVLSMDRLLPILDLLNESFPDLNRIGVYFNARNILSKSDEEIQQLVQRKLTIGYIGLESGSDLILERVQKGATSQEMIEAVLKAQKNGMKISVIGLLGLGGIEHSTEHAIKTASAVSAMKPRYFSLLTLMIVRGTPLYRDFEAKKFILPDEKGLLREMRAIIENIETERTIFRTNHASNYLPLEGILSRDKKKLVEVIDLALQGKILLKPEYFRGL